MAKQVVEEFPEIPAIINITPSTEMMSQYRKSLAKEILLASGIKHFEQTVYFHVRHREINDNPIYIIIIAVSRQEYCCMCGKSEKDQTEEQCTWVFTMPFLSVYYFCKVKTNVLTSNFTNFYYLYICI